MKDCAEDQGEESLLSGRGTGSEGDGNLSAHHGAAGNGVGMDEPALYLAEFSRLLKKGGQISLVKHNEVGRIMQTVVFANDTNLALDLLSGKSYQSHTMGQATYYEIADLLQKADTELTVQDYQGIRIFYGLQDNAVKTANDWREKMLEVELVVCQQSPYRDIAAFQHIWLQKGDKNDSLLCK